MKTLWTLLKREYLEWRTVLLIVGVLFVLLLALTGYGMYKFAEEYEHGNLGISGDHNELQLSPRDSVRNDSGEMEFGGKTLKTFITEEPGTVLDIWSHIIRGIPVGINFLLILLAVFYLADATYKERSNNSTYYYRSLPVPDIQVLSSKLIFGTVGILLLSMFFAVILVSYLHLIFPGDVNQVLEQSGYALSRLDLGHYYFQWAGFHLLQLCWLLPFAVYFLFVSTTVKGRPLLTGVGILLLAAILWKYLFGQAGIENLFTVNFGILGDVLRAQWVQSPSELGGDSVRLFGSLYQYLPTLRTVISLAIAAGGFWGTLALYRRNIEVS